MLIPSKIDEIVIERLKEAKYKLPQWIGFQLNRNDKALCRETKLYVTIPLMTWNSYRQFGLLVLLEIQLILKIKLGNISYLGQSKK